MNKETYKDKVYGCWLGKSIGGTIGTPMEGTREFVNLPEKYPEETVANDDLDLQLVWLDILEKKNGKIVASDLAQGWLECITYPFDEYGVANANLRMGLTPPYSGIYNNFFKDCMGSPIRSEIWACISPKQPGLAGYFAYLDAQVDHWDEGVYGEIFFAVLESLAFSNSNIPELLEEALSYISEKSAINNVVALACECYKNGDTLVESRNKILAEFGEENFTHCVQNIGFTVLGLLYGEGKLLPSILKAIECGYDTDCTGATAGAIIGIILGGKAILDACDMEIDERVIAGKGICNINPPANLQEMTNRTISMSEKIKAVEYPAISKYFNLPEVEAAPSPLNYRFIVNNDADKVMDMLANNSYSSNDIHCFDNSYFDLSQFANGKTLTMGTRINLNAPQTLFFYPVYKAGIKFSINGEEKFSSTGEQPFVPAPHRPNSPEAEVTLNAGEHTILMTLEPTDKDKTLGWIISDKKRQLVVDLEYILK